MTIGRIDKTGPSIQERYETIKAQLSVLVQQI